MGHQRAKRIRKDLLPDVPKEAWSRGDLIRGTTAYQAINVPTNDHRPAQVTRLVKGPRKAIQFIKRRGWMSITQMYEKQIAALKAQCKEAEDEAAALRVELGEAKAAITDLEYQLGTDYPELSRRDFE